MKTILVALLWLAPQLKPATAKHYAEIIDFEAKWYRVHPALVLAIGYGETRWNNFFVSKTNDWGLMQIHVNSRGSNRFYGREYLLFNPRVNIREAFRILDMWRVYHNKWCKGDHPYWAHYKWGRRVKSVKHTFKTRRLYKKLLRKFWAKGRSKRVARR